VENRPIPLTERERCEKTSAGKACALGLRTREIGRRWSMLHGRICSR
jgi:hypothetical protein